MMDQILNWWQLRAPRERVLIGLMGALCLLVLYSLLIYRPAASFAQRSKREYESAASASSALLTQVARIESATSRQDASRGRMSVAASVSAAQLPDPVIVEDRSGDIRMSFNNVDGMRLMSWLGEVRQKTGARIAQMQIERGAPGRVSAVITVKRAQ